MRLNRFFSASFLTLLVFVMASSNSFAQQRRVLFESFANSCYPDPDALRASFDQAVAGVVSSEASKIIHLNIHYGNLCDAAAQFDVYGGGVIQRLFGASVVDVAAVDRIIMPGGKRAEGATSGGDQPDWNSAIDDEYSSGAKATLSLVNATLDNIDPEGNLGLIFHADVKVTLNQAISDKLVIRYAIVEDNVTTNDRNNTNPPTSIKNDIVRWITFGDSVVFANGGAAGATQTVGYTQTTLCGSHDPRLVPAKMRLVAFLEEQTSSTNYQVINAAILKQDLSTLPLPVQKLSLVSDSLDGRTFHPGAGGSIPIFFNAQSVHSLIAYYSPDGGTTWDTISPASFSPLTWVLPDTLAPTTQGKIKIVETGGDGIVDIEKGTFSIKPKPSFTLLHPLPTDTVIAGKHFLIRWTKFQADTVAKITLAIVVNGTDAARTVIATNVVDTFYDWVVPDTLAVADIQIVPTNYESNIGATPQTSQQFNISKTIFVGGVSDLMPTPDAFAIRNVYPNPAKQGETMTMQFNLTHSSNATIELFDLLGHSVYHQTFFSSMSTGAFSFPVGNLTPGTYILRMTDGANAASKQIEVVR